MSHSDLKDGDFVYCPPDRGEKGYCGRVKGDPHPATHPTLEGLKFDWVTVRHNLDGTSHVWPSNRLRKT